MVEQYLPLSPEPEWQESAEDHELNASLFALQFVETDVADEAVQLGATEMEVRLLAYLYGRLVYTRDLTTNALSEQARKALIATIAVTDSTGDASNAPAIRGETIESSEAVPLLFTTIPNNAPRYADPARYIAYTQHPFEIRGAATEESFIRHFYPAHADQLLAKAMHIEPDQVPSEGLMVRTQAYFTIERFSQEIRKVRFMRTFGRDRQESLLQRASNYVYQQFDRRIVVDLPLLLENLRIATSQINAQEEPLLTHPLFMEFVREQEATMAQETQHFYDITTMLTFALRDDFVAIAAIIKERRIAAAEKEQDQSATALLEGADEPIPLTNMRSVVEFLGAYQPA